MMRVIAVAAMVMAACVPPESGTGPAGPGYANTAPPPPLVRRETVRTEKPVEGLRVEVRPTGATAWLIGFKNETDTAMTVVWDESSFVTSTGEAGGRLIRGSTRRMDVGRSQVGSPLPPRAVLAETAFVERMIRSEELEAKYGQRALPPDLRERLIQSRTDRERLVIGGRLHLTLETPAGKQTWTGLVEAGPSAEAPSSPAEPVTPAE